ncbi:hypothetical protein GGU10DRAFT_364600 [Lentinula aff. detonsa]|uniref:BTB domain-containing protein n=1 Tax=Lentinula aff. detonsa TaxID=2804958 RepID=A0AA38L3R3_9AGAR|nr:hypothetical protein GGU10DRAFT_364600 [Lentinula aff. detonsa]
MSWTSNANDIKPISDNFSPSKASSSVYPRDFTFYYDYKTFLVEGTLFKFPLTILAMESTIFRDMMELPVSLQPEGSTDENPIRLESVLKDDFRQLLRILAPPQRYREPVPVLTFSEWTSVLKLADMWCMDVVKEHAILTMSGLSGIDPVDKVVVGRRYGIKDWLLPAFNVILQRSQSFTEHDLERLGAPTLLQLVALRERIQPHQYDLAFGVSAFGYSLGTRRQAVSLDFTEAIELNLPDFKEHQSAESECRVE